MLLFKQHIRRNSISEFTHSKPQLEPFEEPTPRFIIETKKSQNQDNSFSHTLNSGIFK